MKRKPLPPKKSEKIFTKTAQKVNGKNATGAKPMRGGYRL